MTVSGDRKGTFVCDWRIASIKWSLWRSEISAVDFAMMHSALRVQRFLGEVDKLWQSICYGYLVTRTEQVAWRTTRAAVDPSK